MIRAALAIISFPPFLPAYFDLSIHLHFTVHSLPSSLLSCYLPFITSFVYLHSFSSTCSYSTPVMGPPAFITPIHPLSILYEFLSFKSFLILLIPIHGLFSRFKERITFKNWESSHCLELLLSLCAAEGVELPQSLHGAIEGCFNSLIQRVGWANARDVHTVYDRMKSSRECRLDEESNQNDDDDVEDSGDCPYTFDDTMTALEDMIKQRKLLREVNKSIPKITLDQMMQNMTVSDTLPIETMVQKLNVAEVVKEEREEEKEADEEEGKEADREEDVYEDEDDWCMKEEEDLDPDAVWSSLDTALSEKGYTIYTTRDLLQSGSLPADLIELVASKVSSKPDKVKPMLLAQCPVLLPKVLLLIKDIEDEIDLRRLIKAEMERANEEEMRVLRQRERKRQEEAIMHRVRMIGRCCMGYDWIKQAGGYCCAGGSRYVSDSMVNTHEN